MTIVVAPSTFHQHDEKCWLQLPDRLMTGYGKTQVVQCQVILDKQHPNWSVYVAQDVGVDVESLEAARGA